MRRQWYLFLWFNTWSAWVIKGISLQTTFTGKYSILLLIGWSRFSVLEYLDFFVLPNVRCWNQLVILRWGSTLSNICDRDQKSGRVIPVTSSLTVFSTTLNFGTSIDGSNFLHPKYWDSKKNNYCILSQDIRNFWLDTRHIFDFPTLRSSLK